MRIRFAFLLLTLLLLLAASSASAVTANEVSSKLNTYYSWMKSKGYTTNMLDAENKYCATVFWNANVSTDTLKKALAEGNFNTGTTTTKCPRTTKLHSYSATCHSNYFSGGRQCNGFVRYLWYYLYDTDLEWGSDHQYSTKYTSYNAAGGIQQGDMIGYDGHYGIVDYVESSGKIVFYHANGWSTKYPCGIARSYWYIEQATDTYMTTSFLAKHAGTSAFIRRHKDLDTGTPIVNPGTSDDCGSYGCSAANGSGTYQCTADDLVIHSAHNYNSSSQIGVVPLGAIVKVDKIASTGTYAHITYNGISGIVSKNYLIPYSDSCTNYGCSVANGNGRYRCTVPDSLVIHSTHDYKDSSAIGYIPPNAIVTVEKIASNGTYAHVIYNGISGIASKNYLSRLSSYTISFNANGGTIANHAVTVWKDDTTGSNVADLHPTSADYIFTGWYTAASGGQKVFDEAGAALNSSYWNNGVFIGNANATLYAQWTPRVYYMETLSLSTDALTLYPGDTATLTYSYTPANTTNTAVEWATSNPSVVTVSSGRIVAVGVGTTIISVSSTDESGASSSCLVTVAPMMVSGITLNEKTCTMKSGEQLMLSAMVTPQNATNAAVSWASNDPAVVSVSNGLVTALNAGSAIVTASAADGSGVTASCMITVEPVVDTLELDRYSITLASSGVGDHVKIIPLITPEDASCDFVWSTNHPLVATVDAEGMVTAVGVGRAIITAEVKDGPTVSCVINVKDLATLQLPSATQIVGSEAFVGGSYERIWMPASVEQINSRAFADNNHLLYALIPDSVTLIAPDAFAGDENLCIVCGVDSYARSWAAANGIRYMTDALASFVPVGSITLPSSLSVSAGDVVYMKGIVRPTTATNKEIVWQSSDPSVIYVSEDGMLKALCPGQAFVTASAADGSGVTASCAVTISLPDIVVTYTSNGAHAGVDSAAPELTLNVTGVPISEVQSVVFALCDASGSVLHRLNAEPVFIGSSSSFRFDLHECFGIDLAPETAYAYRMTATIYGVPFESELYRFTTLKAVPQIIMPSALTLAPGQVSDMNAVVRYFAETDELMWMTSRSSVAKMTPDGKIQAVGEGTAIITAMLVEDTSIRAVCTVTVEAAAPQAILVSSVSMSEQTISLPLGSTALASAAVLPANADDPVLVWTSDNPAVAAVDLSGVITAVSIGTANITATARDGSGCAASCLALVTPIQVSSVMLNHTNLALQVGQTSLLIASVSPADAANQQLQWSSSAPGIAKVEDGTVKAIAEGSAVITAAAMDGSGITTTCTVTVTAVHDAPAASEFTNPDGRITFSTYSTTPTATSATVSVNLTKSSSSLALKEYGVYIYNANQTLYKSWRDINAYPTTTKRIWFDTIQSECGITLSPATTYYWQVFVICDGQEYRSEKTKFTTLAQSQTVVNPDNRITFSNLSSSASATSAAVYTELIKSSASLNLPQYGIYVYNADKTLYKSWSAANKYPTSTNKIWFDSIEAECGITLQPETTYYWQIFVMCDNKEYRTDILPITTSKASSVSLPIVTSVSYQSGPYYQKLVDAIEKYRGTSQAELFVQIALSQRNYRTGSSVNELHGTGAGKGLYTEYAVHLNKQNRDWCASFVSWCARMAGIPTSIINNSAGAGYMKACGEVHEIWNNDFTGSALGSFEPKRGDLIVFMPRNPSGGHNNRHAYENGVLNYSGAHVVIITDATKVSDGVYQFTTIERGGINTDNTDKVGTRTKCTNDLDETDHCWFQAIIRPAWQY